MTIYGMDPKVGQSLDGFPFSLYSTLCLHISSLEYVVPPSKKDQSIHTLVFLLEIHGVYEICILDILSFWANIHLLVSAYLMCYIYDWLTSLRMIFSTSICLRIS